MHGDAGILVRRPAGIRPQRRKDLKPLSVIAGSAAVKILILAGTREPANDGASENSPV